MTQLTANGISLEYEERGEGIPMVMMRGLGTQLIDWPEVLLDGLVAVGFRVITFDNRDVGLSEKFTGTPNLRSIAKGEIDPPYRLDDMAADVIGLLDSLGIEKAHLFGISMGGMIGQVVAASYGDRLLSFFSVMSSSSRPGLPQATAAAAKVLNRETDANASVGAIIQATSDGLAVCGSPGYPTPEHERLALARRRLERCYEPDGVMRQMAAVVASGSRVELLGQIAVPTMVIHGADDPLIPPAAGKDTAEIIPGATLRLIEGMGHDLPEALAPKFIDLIIEHTEKVADNK